MSRERRRSRRRVYPALAGFYAADPRRRASRERDLGLRWSAPRGWPTFRAAWVADTGELYLVQHGPSPGAGRVTLLAAGLDWGRLESRLPDWREACGRPGSVSWLTGRLA